MSFAGLIGSALEGGSSSYMDEMTARVKSEREEKRTKALAKYNSNLQVEAGKKVSDYQFEQNKKLAETKRLDNIELENMKFAQQLGLKSHDSDLTQGRQGAQNQFTSSENDKNRTQQTNENDKSRAHQTTENAANRTNQFDIAKYNQNAQTGRQILSQEHAKSLEGIAQTNRIAMQNAKTEDEKELITSRSDAQQQLFIDQNTWKAKNMGGQVVSSYTDDGEKTNKVWDFDNQEWIQMGGSEDKSKWSDVTVNSYFNKEAYTQVGLQLDPLTRQLVSTTGDQQDGVTVDTLSKKAMLWMNTANNAWASSNGKRTPAEIALEVFNDDYYYDMARQSINAGAPRSAIDKQLTEWGLDPSKL